MSRRLNPFLVTTLVAVVALLFGAPWEATFGRPAVANAQGGAAGASGPIYSARGAPAGPSYGGAPMPATAPDVGSLSGTFSEGFDNITTLPGSGWVLTNNSQPAGLNSWFQGNASVFPAHSGAPSSYIGANFNNTTGIGTISNWLITPVLTLANGETFSFWTRTVSPVFPDRLQVRMSLAGASSNTGGTATSVGDFTTLLLDIDPTYAGTYPIVWTQYTILLSGIPAPTAGRLAFRYFVEGGGPNGANSDYIGIDTVTSTVPLDVTLERFEATAQGDDVLVEWETVSELDNLGFDLLRGTTADEEPTRINPTLIPSAAGGSSSGASYEYLDEALTNGAYFYWLESVSTTGERERFGPIMVTVGVPTAVTLDSVGGQPTPQLPLALIGMLGAAAALLIWRRLR